MCVNFIKSHGGFGFFRGCRLLCAVLRQTDRQTSPEALSCIERIPHSFRSYAGGSEPPLCRRDARPWPAIADEKIVPPPTVR